MLHSVKFALATLVAVLLSALSPSAQVWAAVIISGSSSGSFGTPLIDSSVDFESVFSIEKPDDQTETFTLGEPGEGSMPNQLTFVGKDFSATNDQVFSVGSLTYLNGQTFSGTNASSVPLGVNINLLQPTRSQQQFEYRFAFNLTPNTDSSSSADRLTISENPSPQIFAVEQDTYSIEILGFSPDDGATFTRSFQIPEDQSIDSTLFAKIKRSSMAGNGSENDDSGIDGSGIDGSESGQPTDVPEPAAIAGLLVIAGAMQIRRSRITSQATYR